MLWPALTALAVLSLIVLQLWWHRRYRAAEDLICQQSRELATLEDAKKQLGLQELIKRQALFDGMIEGVVLLGQDARVEFINLTLRRLLGLTSDARGRTILEVVRKPEIKELLRRVTEENQVIGTELDLNGPTPRCLQVNASSLRNQEGRREGVLLVFHDVTRIKQLEATRQEFVANVSHELRTPLSLIKGFVETLLSGDCQEPEIVTRFLQTINKHTDRLTFLIEDLLTISRLESGQIILNRKPALLRDLADKVFEDLQTRASAKNTMFDNQIPPGLLAMADADRLQQVFFNLIENAINYGRQGGRVAAGARQLPERRIEIRVEDDGPGIPPDSRERVFERFYRVDRARSRETGGTGLGLSIVKHIVQAHEGEVWVQSDPGSGTTFFFTLPQG